MIKNGLKYLALSLVSAVIPFMVLTSPQLAKASITSDPINGSPSSKIEACKALNDGNDCNAAGGETIQNVIKVVLNILSIISAIIAVIMLIIGGVKYITSQGDSGAVSSAKNTIIYACVGLVIVAMSQFLVKFVLTKTNNSSNSTPAASTPATPAAKTPTGTPTVRTCTATDYANGTTSTCTPPPTCSTSQPYTNQPGCVAPTPTKPKPCTGDPTYCPVN